MLSGESRLILEELMSLLWLLPSVAIAHVFEEFFFPGGFGDWDRQYRRDFTASITTPFHIVINIIFIAFCFLPLILSAEIAIAWWLCMGSVFLVNSRAGRSCSGSRTDVCRIFHTPQ